MTVPHWLRCSGGL